jgi:hypothetical protein
MGVWLSGVDQQVETSGGTFTGGPDKGVLHSTEGTDFPDYGYAPHLTGKPIIAEKRIAWRQHVSLDVAARAMENRTGGVQTNRDSARQIELVGTTDPKHEKSWNDQGRLLAGRDYIYYPDAPDWVLYEVAAMMIRVSALCGIDRRLIKDWLPYPKSYGNSAVRMSLSEWDNFGAWCAHQHAAENSHGDVFLDVARLSALLGADPVAKPQPVAVRAPVKVSRAAPRTPRFPLPAGHAFGPKTGPKWQHSGYYGASDRNGLRTWQKQMRDRGWRISVDGLYGKETAHVAKEFQKRKGLEADGLIGAATWAAAWS